MAKKPETTPVPAATEPQLDQPKVDASPRERTGETVTVACKIPNGIYIQLWDMVDVLEMGPLGARAVSKARRRPGFAPIRLNGPSVPHNMSARYTIAGGFALTEGVPRGAFDEWLSQNADADFVRNGLVFCAPRAADAMDMAREKESVRSGMEPIDPDAPPREMQTQNRHVKLERAGA